MTAAAKTTCVRPVSTPADRSARVEQGRRAGFHGKTRKQARPGDRRRAIDASRKGD